MFRQYEDPRKLETMLAEARAALEVAKNDPDYEGLDLVYLYEDVASLEERVNFAWQDEEYDENYARDYYPEEYEEVDYDEA